MSTENPNTVIDGQGVLLQDRVIGGVEYKAGMGPVERAQTLARSVEAGTYAPSHSGVAPPLEYQTRATEQSLAQGESNATAVRGARAGKAPPPSPKELEASRRANLEAFDQEMREKGLQKQSRDSSGRFASVPADQVDAAGIEALNKAFAALTPAQRDAKRAQYLKELREFYEGRRLGESRDAFHARKNGESAPVAPTQQQYTPQQWKDGHKSVTDKDGWIPLERINTAGLSGYTLPKLVDKQVYNSGVFEQLADSRAAGFTQQQVDSYIKAQMQRDGWLKA